MKSIILALMILGISFCGVATADVTSLILKKDIDDNDNIRVYTQYMVDGEELESKYPKLDGKYYYVSRYDFMNFIKQDGTIMSEAEKEIYIELQIKFHRESLLRQTFIKKNNLDVQQTELSNLVGKQGTTKTATMKINDTKEWEVKTDGTKVEKIIIP